MNSGLKRIEATLEQLGISEDDSAQDLLVDESSLTASAHRLPPSPPQSDLPAGHATADALSPSTPPSRSSMRTIEPFPFPVHTHGSAGSAELNGLIPPIPAVPPEANTAGTGHRTANPSAAGARAVSTSAAHPSAASTSGVKMPTLPKPKPASDSPPRQAAQPQLALGLVKELENRVQGWQRELEQLVKDIQVLYDEGPIVDGWLESQAFGSNYVQSYGASMLRHAEIEHLMEYVEQICQMSQLQTPEGLIRADYRLCGLDADGRLWSRPCPTEQVPYVGLAIARYQKLRILLEKKQAIESRLTHLVETLTMLHGELTS